MAPLAQLLSIVQRHLHFKIELYTINSVLRGVVEPDAEDLPVDLSRSSERFSGIECTHVTVSCINAKHIVGGAIFVARNSRRLPGR